MTLIRSMQVLLSIFLTSLVLIMALPVRATDHELESILDNSKKVDVNRMILIDDTKSDENMNEGFSPESDLKAEDLYKADEEKKIKVESGNMIKTENKSGN